MSRAPEVVIFDLGGVLIDWDPRHLYRKLIDDDGEMEHFLATVCTRDWNEQQDAGRSFAEAVAELSAQYPDRAHLIEAYWRRWPEMIAGAMDDSVAILGELKAGGLRLYALSNWSAETWPHARDRFDFLAWFDGLVISGLEGVKKPVPEIYDRLLERFQVRAEGALFIDDVEANVEAARRRGLPAVVFEGAPALRRELAGRGLPVSSQG